ncbi:hypothetical protein BpHYR1_015412 [Brachionus plicatilis]|uniref:Uncharacterized protein n=1 Tax=Brachionus plicatilis TaxID=10195 RepID=A0A3M7R322_BRAPC|nr:hypothetical protein BpHYR1_015412 [Brachionus plicatilis]
MSVRINNVCNEREKRPQSFSLYKFYDCCRIVRKRSKMTTCEEVLRMIVGPSIMNNRDDDRSGIARYRVIPAKTNGRPNGQVSIFFAMRRACYNAWLIDILKKQNIRCYAEDQHWVFQLVTRTHEVERNTKIVPTPAQQQSPANQPQHQVQQQSPAPSSPDQAQEQHPQSSQYASPQQRSKNIYSQVHLNVDADQLVNRLAIGRGRIIRFLGVPEKVFWSFGQYRKKFDIPKMNNRIIKEITLRYIMVLFENDFQECLKESKITGAIFIIKLNKG